MLKPLVSLSLILIAPALIVGFLHLSTPLLISAPCLLLLAAALGSYTDRVEMKIITEQDLDRTIKETKKALQEAKSPASPPQLDGNTKDWLKNNVATESMSKKKLFLDNLNEKLETAIEESDKTKLTEKVVQPVLKKMSDLEARIDKFLALKIETDDTNGGEWKAYTEGEGLQKELDQNNDSSKRNWWPTRLVNLEMIKKSLSEEVKGHREHVDAAPTQKFKDLSTKFKQLDKKMDLLSNAQSVVDELTKRQELKDKKTLKATQMFESYRGGNSSPDVWDVMNMTPEEYSRYYDNARKGQANSHMFHNSQGPSYLQEVYNRED